MKTDDLIKAISADAGSVDRPVARTLLIGLAGALAIVIPVFLGTLGLRGDIATVVRESWQFLFKFVITAGVLVPAYFLVRELARPEADPKTIKALLWVAPALLAAAIGYELYSLPSDLWGLYTVGTNAFACVTLIPALSLLPLAAILYALRQGAPANPGIAGAFGGLLAAAIGATVYATHCVNDSPLFVGAWYPIGTAVVVGLGALAGTRLLKW